MTDEDRQVVDRWWRHFVASGQVPDEFAHVQGRLIRAVHRGQLPSGPVHVKTMAFPRAKDRLRYAFRALPAQHEASMLRRAAAAGIVCPEVVAVRTRRRFGLPHRSLLVLRTLPVVADGADRSARVDDEVAITAQLLAAGFVHRDLHTDNFVRLDDGRLAVLDLQSVSLHSSGTVGERDRLAVAARLVRDRHGDDREKVLRSLRSHGIVRDDRDLQRVVARSDAAGEHYRRSRLNRCFTTSTGFVRTIRATGIEYRVRDWPAPGRWWRGAGDLRAAWVGQRARELADGTPLFFGAFFRKWWWLGGGAALYVPETCSDERINAEVEVSASVIRGSLATHGQASPHVVRGTD